jgi:hypothetical protein
MNEETWIHDEDSDHPNCICDEEPELSQDEALMHDIICETLFELEEAVKKEGEKVMIDRKTILKALQLLKTYNALYYIDYDEYCTEWD